MKKTTPFSFLKLKLGPLALLFAMVFGAVSCDTADEVSPDQGLQTTLQDIPAELKKLQASSTTANSEMYPTFNTLLVALGSSGLSPTVAMEELTLFAPTDAAFEKLGLNPSNVASVPNLKEILLYHVVAGQVLSTDLKNGFVPTLNGAAVEIMLKNGVMVNTATVQLADIRALNGVIHVIDEVLMPPMYSLSEIAYGNESDYSLLIEGVKLAGLEQMLSEGGPYTIFAPTNAALQSALMTMGYASLNQVPVEFIREIVLYHVVKGRVYSSDLVNGSNVPTLSGDTFRVNLSDLTLIDTQNRKAKLEPELLNVQATDGVVHVIHGVLLPNLED